MTLYDKIKSKEEKISLIGLGYVGMPIAVAFAKVANVIGFDISKEKIELYKKGIDPTKEVGDDAIKKTTVEFTADESKLKEAKFHIVAVPTPINADHTLTLDLLNQPVRLLVVILLRFDNSFESTVLSWCYRGYLHSNS